MIMNSSHEVAIQVCNNNLVCFKKTNKELPQHTFFTDTSSKMKHIV